MWQFPWSLSALGIPVKLKTADLLSAVYRISRSNRVVALLRCPLYATLVVLSFFTGIIPFTLIAVQNQDKSKILSENGLKTLNIFRKLALLMHKKYIAAQKKKQSIKGNMFDCLLNDEKLLQIILSL